MKFVREDVQLDPEYYEEDDEWYNDNEDHIAVSGYVQVQYKSADKRATLAIEVCYMGMYLDKLWAYESEDIVDLITMLQRAKAQFDALQLDRNMPLSRESEPDCVVDVYEEHPETQPNPEFAAAIRQLITDELGGRLGFEAHTFEFKPRYVKTDD